MIPAPSLQKRLVEKTGFVSREWAQFFSGLYRQALKNRDDLQASGSSANRPTTGLYVGRQYFDTTLGKPIWCDSTSPASWVDATGATVL